MGLYCVPPSRQGERQEEESHRLIEEKKREVAAFFIKKTHDELIAKIKSEKPKIAMMRDVMKHQLLSDEEVANIFNGEWGIVKTSGILDTIMSLRVNRRWRRIIISTIFKSTPGSEFEYVASHRV